MRRFEGKAVLVTGAGSGIGYAMCRLFAREGAWVALNDMNEALAREATGKINAVGEVMWLMKMIRVRGVTAFQNDSMNSSCVVTGTGTAWRTYEAPLLLHIHSHVRSSAPYSWSVVRISSPCSSGNDRATTLSPDVAFET